MFGWFFWFPGGSSGTEPIADVVSAIVELFDGPEGDAARALLADGTLHDAGFAPRGKDTPYALVFEVAEVPDAWTFGTGYTERTEVQISIVAASRAEAKRIGLAMQELLDDAPLVVDGRTVRSCVRTAAHLEPADPTQRGRAGQELHQQTLDYAVIRARTRPRA